MADVAQPLTGYQATKNTSGTTSRGTKIVTNGNDLDKNSFLQILTAELSNQDPDNAKDSTQYVAQMAQFASLEQMTNLNSTMTFNGASSLIGKYVNMSTVDASGNYYNGYVRNVVKDGSNVKVTLEMGTGANKVTKDFNYSDVYAVVDDGSTGLDENSKFMLASSLMGKTVDAITIGSDNKTKTITGVVTSVSRETDSILTNIHYTDTDGTAKDISVPYDYISKVDNV